MPERGGTAKKNLYCIGTLDTKGPEIHFLAECLSSALARFQLDNVRQPLSSASFRFFENWVALRSAWDWILISQDADFIVC